MPIRPDESVTEYLARLERERTEKYEASKRSPVEANAVNMQYNGPRMPDKGRMDGSCNRQACQMPLKDEPVRCSMRDHETFVEGKRLYYCMKCADIFDDADRGRERRITREPK